MTEHEMQLRIAELERSYDKMEKDLAFRTEQAEQLQAENERLKEQLEKAEKLIATMKNNKKAILWLRELRGEEEKAGDTNG